MHPRPGYGISGAGGGMIGAGDLDWEDPENPNPWH